MWDKVIFLIIGIMGVEDLRKRMVSLWKIVVFAAVILLAVFHTNMQMTDVEKISCYSAAAGSFPGIMLWIIGKAAKGSVGEADSLIILGLGIYMGFWMVMSILTTALLLVFLASALLLIAGKKSKNYEIPFVPFLFVGMAGSMFWG